MRGRSHVPHQPTVSRRIALKQPIRSIKLRDVVKIMRRVKEDDAKVIVMGFATMAGQTQEAS